MRTDWAVANTKGLDAQNRALRETLETVQPQMERMQAELGRLAASSSATRN